MVVFAGEGADSAKRDEVLACGVEVVTVPLAGPGGEMDLGYVLDELGRRGIRGVLVEGGGETVGRFVREGLANKMTLFYAPKLLGAGGAPLMGSLVVDAVGGAPGFRVEGVEMFGEDVALTLYPARTEEI